MSKRQVRLAKVQKKIEPLRSPEEKPILQHEPRPIQAVSPQVAYQRAQVNGNGLMPADLLALQRVVGNRQVQRMVEQRPNRAHGRLASAEQRIYQFYQLRTRPTPDSLWLKQEAEETPSAPENVELTKWAYGYKTKREVEVQYTFIKSLGLEAEKPKLEGKLWVFSYRPLTEAQAKDKQKVQEAKLGKTYDVTVEYSERAKSFYVKSEIKCPEGAPDKPNYSFSEKEKKQVINSR